MFLKRTEARLRFFVFFRFLPPPLYPQSGPSCCTSPWKGTLPTKRHKKKLSGKNDGPLATVVRDQVRPPLPMCTHTGVALSIISARERVRTPSRSHACALKRARGWEGGKERQRGETIELAATARTKNGPCPPTLRTPCEIISRMRWCLARYQCLMFALRGKFEGGLVSPSLPLSSKRRTCSAYRKQSCLELCRVL